MFTLICNRFRRAPVMALCVILMAAVLSAALCALEPIAQLQQRNFEALYESIPVQISVTNLTGTRTEGLKAPAWAAKVFTDKHLQDGLFQYVKDVQLKSRQRADSVTIGETPYDGRMTLVGLTGLSIAPELAIGDGTMVTWFQDYDESVLKKSRYVCILPENLLPEDYDPETGLSVTLTFQNTLLNGNTYYSVKTLEVIGIHKAGLEQIYCPNAIMTGIYKELQAVSNLDAICATLTDNHQLEELREASRSWFAEPNPTGERTPWRYSYYFYYPYALRIDDSKLRSIELDLKVGLLLNEVCSYFLIVLSAGAGFLIGFLMIRSRKREINLMRSLGTSGFNIFFGLLMEQMLCVLLGTIAGGIAFAWQPISRVLAFVLIYFVGLSIALVMFLNSNLLANLKEAE